MCRQKAVSRNVGSAEIGRILHARIFLPRLCAVKVWTGDIKQMMGKLFAAFRSVLAHRQVPFWSADWLSGKGNPFKFKRRKFCPPSGAHICSCMSGEFARTAQRPAAMVCDEKVARNWAKKMVFFGFISSRRLQPFLRKTIWFGSSPFPLWQFWIPVVPYAKCLSEDVPPPVAVDCDTKESEEPKQQKHTCRDEDKDNVPCIIGGRCRMTHFASPEGI